MRDEHGTMPDFLCIGFQKCGTTTMHDLLSCDSQLALPRDVKEPMFYRVPFIYHLFWPWRKRYYSWRYYGYLRPNDSRTVGEINAGLTYAGCAKILERDFSPETRLFFMLRNPVTRSYSAFKFFCALGFLPAKVIREDLRLGHAEAFDRYCRRVLKNPRRCAHIDQKRMKYLCFSQGNYAERIAEYDAFPHRYFMLFEDFVRDQRGECEKLYDYLGLSLPKEGIPFGLQANETDRRAVSPLRAKWRMLVKGGDYALDEFFSVSQWAPGLYRCCHKFTRRMYRTCTAPDSDKDPMKASTQQLLEDYYRPQKEHLSKLLGRNLDDIWFQ